jgi:peptide/nickel transport system substrate-binding protein
MEFSRLRKKAIMAAVLLILAISSFASAPLAFNRANAQSNSTTSSLTGRNYLNIADFEYSSSIAVSSFNWFSPIKDYDLTELLYVGLFTVAFPPEPLVVPVLAQGYSVNANATQFVITLRPNLKWSDGSPLNATDLWYTLWLLNATDNAPVATSITIMNSTSVQVTFPTPQFQYVQSTLAGGDVVVVPYETFGKIPVDEIDCSATNGTCFADFSDIVADGPYTLSKYTTGENPLVLSANPYYFEGPPHLSTVNVWLYPDAESEIAAYKADQLDAFWTYGAYDTVIPVVAYTGHTLIQAIPALTYAILFNAFGNNYPFTDSKFRLALAYATNITQINSAVNGPYANSSASTEDSLLPTANEELGFPGSGPIGYNYSVTEAKNILASDGFTLSGGTLHYPSPNGSAVSIQLAYEGGNPTAPDIAPLLAQEWGQLGITVNVKSEADSTIQSLTLGDTGWQVIIAGDTGLNVFGVTTGPSIATAFSAYGYATGNGGTAYYNNTVGAWEDDMSTYPQFSAQFNSTAVDIAKAYVTQAPFIPLFNSYNWQSVSDQFYWGTAANNTGIFNTQATAQQQFYWDTLYLVAPLSTPAPPVSTTQTFPTSTTSTTLCCSTSQITTSTTSSTSSSGIPSLYLYAAVAAVVIVIAGVAATMIFRRRS